MFGGAEIRPRAALQAVTGYALPGAGALGAACSERP
jgi:hypothetical protein